MTGGVVHEKGLLAQDLPPWLKKITRRICEESSLFPSDINHVLINEYLPDQGIMPHQDGPAYVPVVAILSLGSPVVMDFTPHPSLVNSGQVSENGDKDSTELGRVETTISSKKSSEPRPFSVVLMPRSLLIFKDEAYSDYLHGIRDSDIHQLNEVVNVVPEMSVSASKNDGDSSNEDGGAGMVIHRTSTRVSLTCRVVSKVRKHLIKN